MPDLSHSVQTPACEAVASPETFTVRVYDRAAGFSFSERSPYVMVMQLTDLGMGDCRLHGALGQSDAAVNQALYTLLREMGYRRCFFEVRRGTKVSRHAQWWACEGPFDRYCVALGP